MSRKTLPAAFGVLLALVGVAAIAAPVVTGIVAESAFRDHLQRVQSGRSDIDWTVDSFRQGAFRSTAESVITVPGSKEAGDTVLRLEHEILHGPTLARPFVFEIVTTLKNDRALLGSVAEAFSPAEPVTGTFTAPLIGRPHLAVRSPALPEPVAMANGGTAEWGGLDVDIDWNRDDQHADLSGTMPRLLIESPEGRLRIRDVTLEGTAERTADGPWSGSSTLHIAHVLGAPADGAAGGRLQLHDLAVRSDSSWDEQGALSTRARARVRRIDAGDMALRSLDVDIRLERLHRSLLEAARGSGTGPNKRLKDVDFPAVVGLEPQLAIDPVAVETEHGSVNARVSARLVQGSLPASKVTAANWLRLLEAEARLEMPTPLARAAATAVLKRRLAAFGSDGAMPEESVVQQLAREQLDNLVESGLLERRDGIVATRAQFRNGGLTVNGQRLF